VLALVFLATRFHASICETLRIAEITLEASSAL
jgi:hypothetical protein